METAEIVKVAVGAAPYSIDKPYDYLVPPELTETAVPGVRVTVPFGRGNRTSEGILLARGAGEKVRGLKPLLSVLDREPVLDAEGIALALWLRQRYFCTMFEAAKAILPAGLWYCLREVWRVPEGMDRFTADGLSAGIRRATPVLDALFAAGGAAGRTRAASSGLCSAPGPSPARPPPAGRCGTGGAGWWSWPSAPRRPKP